MEGGAEGIPIPAEAKTSPDTLRAAETRNTREQVLNAFNGAFSEFDKASDSSLSPELQASRDLLRQVKEKTLDKGKFSYKNRFKGDDGKEYTQMEYLPVEGLITFLRQRIESGELSPEQEKDYREKEKIIHGSAQEYYRGRNKKVYERKIARIQQEAERIAADPRLGTGDPHQDFLRANEALLERRELIVPPERRVVDPPPPPPPPPIEEIRRDFVLANRNIDIQKRAAEMAELQLRAEQRRGSAWNPLNWPRKIGLRVAEEHYRQVYIERAREAMLANNNAYLDYDVVNNAARDVNYRIDQERSAGKAVVEQIKTRVETGEGIEGQRVVEATGALKTMMMDQIIRPVIDGTITTQAQVQELLRNFVRDNETDPQVQAVFGRDATQYGRLAEYFASDLLETGQLVRQDLAAHRYSLDQLDRVVRIQLANSEWAAQTQARFNMVDRAVAWAESNRLRGWLLNPATIGAAASIGFYGIGRLLGYGASAASVVAPAGGLVFGAGVAAVRRYHDLKVDMAAHRSEMAYGGEIPGTGAPRREALERFNYDTAQVDQLIGGGGQESLTGEERLSLEVLRTSDLSIDSNREALMRRVAEIKSRLDFSTREQVDLITFTGREQVEQGRLGLIRGIVEAKRALRDSGVSDADILSLENRFTGEWNAHFTQNRAQQENNFNCYRMRNAVGAAVFGGITGLASGLVTQELLALAGRALGNQVGSTAIENMLGGRLPWERDSGGAASIFNIDKTRELFDHPTNLDVTDRMQLAVDPNIQSNGLRNATLILDGKTVDLGPLQLDKDGHLLLHGNLGNAPKEVRDFFGMQEPHPTIDPMKNVREGVADWFKSPNRHDTFQFGDLTIDVNPDGKLHDGAKGDKYFNMSMTLFENTEHALNGAQNEAIRAHGQVSLMGDGSAPTFNFDTNAPGNERLTPVRLQEFVSNLQKDGWNVTIDHQPAIPSAGTVVDQMLNQSPDVLRSQGIIETDQFQKTWNFHVLRPDIVSSTGMHTHNELTLHLGGQFDVLTPNGIETRTGSGAPGELDCGATLRGLIESHLKGVPSARDPLLDGIYAKKPDFSLKDMLFVVDLTNDKQIMVPMDANGHAKLPDELFDPATGGLRGVKTIAEVYLQSPDGTILSAQDLLNSGQIPQGSVVHSLASERFAEIAPPPAPPKPGFDAYHLVPPDATEFIPPPAPPAAAEPPPIIVTPFTPRHPLEPLNRREPPVTPPEEPPPPEVPPPVYPEGPYVDTEEAREIAEAKTRLETFIRTDPHLLDSEKDEAADKVKEFMDRPEVTSLGGIHSAELFEQIYGFISGSGDIDALKADDGSVDTALRSSLEPIVDSLTSDAGEKEELIQVIGKFVRTHPDYLTDASAENRVRVITHAYRTTKSILSYI